MNIVASFLKNTWKSSFIGKKLSKPTISSPHPVQKGIQRMQVFDQFEAEKVFPASNATMMRVRRKLVQTLAADVIPKALGRTSEFVLVQVTHAAPMLAFADHKKIVRDVGIRPMGLPVVLENSNGPSKTYFWALPRMT